MIAKLKQFFRYSRTILFARLTAAAATVVGLHDFVWPILMSTDITPITSILAPWEWTLIVLCISITVEALRRVTSKSLEEKAADNA